MNKFTAYFKGDQYAAYSGIELVECEPGYAKAKVTIEEHHLNAARMVHGGLLFTLADLAFAAAVNAYGAVTVSVAASISYFNKSDQGVIIAEAREISRSEKLIHCDIAIKHESGTLLANFKGTAYKTKKIITF